MSRQITDTGSGRVKPSTMSAGRGRAAKSSSSEVTTDATQGRQRATARGVNARCTVPRSR